VISQRVRSLSWLEKSKSLSATLTLLYRLLFLLYAESRDLLPVREAPYHAASLKKRKEEVAEQAGVAEDAVPQRLEKTYSAKETTLYDRLTSRFRVMAEGDDSDLVRSVVDRIIEAIPRQAA